MGAISVQYIFRRTKDLPSLSSDERVFRWTKDMIYYAKTDLFKCIFKMHLKVAPYFHRFSMYIFSWKKLHESPKSHLTNGANKICNHVLFIKKSFVRRKTWQIKFNFPSFYLSCLLSDERHFLWTKELASLSSNERCTGLIYKTISGHSITKSCVQY